MPDAGPLGPATVVVLGLLSAASFGASDFGGGLSTRRLPVLGVMLAVNSTGLVVALAIAALTREPGPEAGTIALAAVGGVSGALGVMGLYRGLAVGRIGVVAPVVGVIGASLPVLVGVLNQGATRLEAGIGIALALVAVVIISRAPSPTGSRSGIEYALLGGLGIGVVSVLIGRLPEGSVWWPLVVLKVAAVLSSLYPVVTVLLAIVVLREQIGRRHAVGIATAAIAVALIAVGSNAPA